MWKKRRNLHNHSYPQNLCWKIQSVDISTQSGHTHTQTHARTHTYTHTHTTTTTTTTTTQQQTNNNNNTTANKQTTTTQQQTNKQQQQLLCSADTEIKIPLTRVCNCQRLFWKPHRLCLVSQLSEILLKATQALSSVKTVRYSSESHTGFV